MKNFKRLLGISVLLTVGASFASAAAFVQVSALATYLSGVGGVGTPTSATIAALNSGTFGSLTTPITAGITTINIVAVGDICFNGLGQTPSACLTGGAQVPTTATAILAYFADAGNVLIAPGVADGVTVSNIVGDFFVPIGAGLNILVPTGTAKIFFTYNDTFFPDNADTNNNFGVNLTFGSNAGVPEPATYGLMLAGLGGLMALKRFRRS